MCVGDVLPRLSLTSQPVEAAPERISAAQDTAELAAMRMGRGGAPPVTAPACAYLKVRLTLDC